MLFKTLFAILSTALAVSATPLEARSCSPTYTVQAGDTCYAIATANGLTVDQLLSYNPSIDCTDLAIDQVLCLGPGGDGGDGGTCTQTYTVESGDTCSTIAADVGLTVSQLEALNPSINSGCTNLDVGQVLCVTGGTSGGGGGGGSSVNGLATYYDPEDGYGACGWKIQNWDMAVAIGSGNWNSGSHCGATMTVTYGSTTIQVTVADLCPGCQGANGIDLTEGAMAAMDPNYVAHGVDSVTWSVSY
ncbi:hypothetical protein MSAN_01131200 [Mycena sanguinolenta]|uniref:LysM domain-containing protein n=1 Tax=Mycena sanguinolenta TaxID=230812 RepID=A0A8H6YNB2_9AGAR|nr:hypothetical protein MSAN_01131200 [Mycena sanguinolenta]